jgi:hypothetical protein
MNYELACLIERLLFSGAFLLPGAFSIQVITAPSASHAAQMGSSPQPTTGPGLPQVLLGCVGSAGPLPASQPLAAPKARTISATPAIQLPIHAHHGMPLRDSLLPNRASPATSTAIVSSIHTAAASAPTAMITPGSPFHCGNQSTPSAHTSLHVCVVMIRA